MFSNVCDKPIKLNKIPPNHFWQVSKEINHSNDCRWSNIEILKHTSLTCDPRFKMYKIGSILCIAPKINHPM